MGRCVKETRTGATMQGSTLVDAAIPMWLQQAEALRERDYGVTTTRYTAWVTGLVSVQVIVGPVASAV